MSKKQLQGPREGMVHRHRHFVTCFFIMAITTAVVRANVSFTTTGGISTSIQYAAEIGGNQNTQGVMGQIRIPF